MSQEPVYKKFTQLIDVNISTAINNNIIVYGTSDNKYVNKTISELGVASATALTSHTGSTAIHFTETSINHTDIQNIGTNTHTAIDTHMASTDNPHSVTATQVGKDTAQWNANELQDYTITGTNPTDGKILVYRTASAAYVLETKPTTGTSPDWGDIGGTLGNQTDLQTVLDTKLSSTTYDTHVAVIGNATTTGHISSTDWSTFNNKADSDSDTTYNATSPLTIVGTTIAIPVANTTTNGYLSSTDWDTFNGKPNTDTDTTYHANTPVTLTGTAFGMSVSNTSQSGYLSSVDWDMFNNKADSDSDTTYNATGPITIVGTTVAIPKSTISVNGYLSSTDWNTFNSKANSDSDTTYNVTSPITMVGTTISMDVASSSNNGYLSSTDWNTFNTKIGSSGEVDHGQLTGLGDDDHSQYLLVNGTRGLSGDWDAGSTHKISIGSVAITPFTRGSIPFISTSGLIKENNNALFFEEDDGYGKLSVGENAVMRNVFQVVREDAETGLGTTKSLMTIRNKGTTDNTFAGFSMQTHDTNGDVKSGGRILTQFTSHAIGSVSGDMIFETRHIGTRSKKMELSSDGKLSLLSGTGVNEFSTDGTLTGDSDNVIPTEKAVKTYVDNNEGDTTYNATSPIDITGTTISVSQSNTSTNGYLSSTDWDTFNGKAPALGADDNYVTDAEKTVIGNTSGTNTGDNNTTYNATSPVDITGTTISVPQSNTTTNGYLSSTDWDVFNNKPSVDTNTTYNATGPLTIVGTTIAIPKSTTSVNGYLSSADWDTFNGKADTDTNTTYNVTAPITLTGTTLAIPKVTTSVNGYLSSTDWDTFNNKISYTDSTAVGLNTTHRTSDGKNHSDVVLNNTHRASTAIHFTKASIDHTGITNIGTNTHTQLDTHVGSSAIHFIEGSIDHTNITNVGSNTHTQLDTHLGSSAIHYTESSIDHTNVTNKGTNTHAQIDTHIASSAIHFKQGAISIPANQISDFDTEVGNNASVVANTAKVTNANHTGDVTGATELTIGANKVHDSMIDWGTSASQVSAVDLLIADAGSKITATEVEGALQENRTAINLNTTHRGSEGSDHTYINQDVRSSADVAFNSLAISAGQKVMFEGAGSDTYLIYSTATSKLQVWVNNTKKAEWG